MHDHRCIVEDLCHNLTPAVKYIRLSLGTSPRTKTTLSKIHFFFNENGTESLHNSKKLRAGICTVVVFQQGYRGRAIDVGLV